ncbi:MAG: DUF3179 domain-containing (seleno)protein, partial [Candidatus Magasanikbacteria bacterium]
WSQVLGESIVGEMAGTELEKIPSDQVRYGDWKKQNPQGKVLSRDTGASRRYGSNPYGGYFSASSFATGLANFEDDRLDKDEFVYGLTVGDRAIAYPVDLLKKNDKIVDEFKGQTFVFRHNEKLDTVRVFKKENGELTRISPVSGFWFSWVTAHPDTKLNSPDE